MDNKRIILTKKLLIGVIPVFFFFTAIFFAIYVAYNNEELKDQILKRDVMIGNSRIRDSLFNKNRDSTASVISKYTSDCSLIVGGKEVSLESLLNKIVTLENEKLDLLKQFNEEEKKYTKSLTTQIELGAENEKQKGMINVTTDSARLYKVMFDYVQRFYGTNVSFKQDGIKRFITREFSRADSALLLYKYFADKIKKDSVSGSWIITR